jgi:hypothetical protein
MTIKQPQNKKVNLQSATAELKFNTNFSKKWNGRLNRAQTVVDSEVLRRSEKYTPLLTGTLIKSGILGTVLGSGLVSWITPYAKRQYYKGRRPGTQQAGPLRGRFWFERMKAVEKKDIVDKVNKTFGGNEEK